jgi:tryptophan-rich sensory protein
MNAAVRSGWKPIISAGLAASTVAVLGATITGLGPWYYSLHMPSWKPPDALFGPAWTLIFALAATSGVLGWRSLPTRVSRATMCGFFAANALFNVLWSVLFFRLHRPDLALLEVSLLWLSILLLMLLLRHASRIAAWLLLPYLAWVSYAAVLNLAVVRMNPVQHAETVRGES